jgi:hypothetical protein
MDKRADQKVVVREKQARPPAQAHSGACLWEVDLGPINARPSRAFRFLALQSFSFLVLVLVLSDRLTSQCLLNFENENDCENENEPDLAV